MAGELNIAQALFQTANKANEEMLAEMEDEFDNLPPEPIEAQTTEVPEPEQPARYSLLNDGPILLGKDAGLFRWDSQQRTLVPAGESARAIIEGKAGGLDVFQAVPGSFLAQPMTWNGNALHAASAPMKRALQPVKTMDGLEIIKGMSIHDHIREVMRLQSAQNDSDSSDSPDDVVFPDMDDAESTAADDREREEQAQAQAQAQIQAPRSVDLLEGSLDKILGFTEKGIRLGAGLARDGAVQTIRGCTELVNKWKQSRAELNNQVATNAAEQMRQRQAHPENATAPTIADLSDLGEVESVTREVTPESIQSNAETMQEKSQDLKREFDSRRLEFRNKLNKNLETIFQAMGYGDPLRPKANSLQEFEGELAKLSEIKQKKVERAVTEIETESSAYRDYITERVESSELADADIEDQQEIANVAKELETNVGEEVNRKYREMLDNIGLNGKSLQASLGDIFNKIGDAINRMLERIGLLRERGADASANHAPEEAQSEARPG